jgi:hypothetical protein
MTKKLNWTRGALLLSAALFGVFGCGSDDDGGGGATTQQVSACFAQCSDGLASCTSAPGLTQASCQSTAESDCGGPPAQVVLQAGCECPGFGDPNECKTPPSWYQ